MKCTKCGNELLPGGNVCEICGNIMEAEVKEDEYDYSMFAKPVIGIIGVFGCIIMIISNFFDLYIYVDEKEKVLYPFKNVAGDGVLIILLSLIALVFIVCRMPKVAYIPTAINLAWLIYLLSYLGSLSPDQLAPADYYDLGPGFYLLVIGIVLTFINPLFIKKKY